MKQLLLFAGIFLSLPLVAQLPTAYDQLVAVNEQWKYQADADPLLKETPAYTLDQTALIRFHLQQTEKLLRSRSISSLTEAEKKGREINLSTLHEYAQQGIFPINTLHTNRQPYFIDDQGTHCAVGYLMKENGGEMIARDIHATQNFSYLFDINHPQLMNWVQGSGLTLDELALIQPGYPGDWPCALMELHYNNTGMDVNEYIEIHESSAALSGGLPFDHLMLYNSNGVLYKTLLKSEMSVLTSGGGYYYSFPSTDTFADKGKIVLIGIPWSSNDTIGTITYSDTSIDLYDRWSNGFYNRHYSIGESEATATGTTLSFCGQYTGNWTLQHMAPTIGTPQPCIIMALQLQSFTGAIDKDKVQLIWKTTSESNTAYFEVERSKDGTSFSNLGKVRATGNSNIAVSYAFTDNHPNYINHYRLKQVDIDGKYTYSKILYVKVPARNGLAVIGNVARNQVTVEVKTEASDADILSVFDLHGRQLYHQHAKPGLQQINLFGLTAGKYLVRLYTKSGMVYNDFFVKQ